MADNSTVFVLPSSADIYSNRERENNRMSRHVDSKRKWRTLDIS
jgi:hypothetical protein